MPSVLAGIAIDRGAKLNPQTPVYSLFPEYASFANPDPRKSKMTLEHLMTMTSDFACDENGDDDDNGNEDKMQGQTEQPDWYKFILDLPLSAAPGEKAAYCTGGVKTSSPTTSSPPSKIESVDQMSIGGPVTQARVAAPSQTPLPRSAPCRQNARLVSKHSESLGGQSESRWRGSESGTRSLRYC